jgi:hypothetical protein
MFQAKVVEKTKYTLYFFLYRAVYEIMWKNFVVRQATDGNILRRRKDTICMPDD